MDEKLKAHFRSIYCMCVADGNIAISELDEMYRIAQESYGLTKEEIDQAILSGGSTIYIPDSLEEKIKYLYDLAQMAAADGIIEKSEVVLLKKYAIKFGFLEDNVDEMVDVLIDYATKKTPIEQILNSL